MNLRKEDVELTRLRRTIVSFFPPTIESRAATMASALAEDAFGGSDETVLTEADDGFVVRLAYGKRVTFDQQRSIYNAGGKNIEVGAVNDYDFGYVFIRIGK